MRWTLPSLSLLLLVACGGSDQASLVAAPDKGSEAPAAPETPEVKLGDLQERSEDIALVPSPIETQRSLEAAGIDTQLATLIPEHTFDLEKAETDPAAVRTGVLLADLLLTVKSAEKDQLLKRLVAIEKGMKQLDGGSDIDATLKDLQERVQADAVTRDELLKEFDELSGAVIPELEFNGNARVVPLIQAGSWLEGANLVAQAVKSKSEPAAADTLLKQPAVVDYFIRYVTTEGAEKAPEAVTRKLEESLTTLRTLAEKSEPLTGEDIDQVIKVTSDVLALL